MKVFSSCIRSTFFSPRADSEEKSGLEKGVLNKKVESHYKKDKSSWEPMICYSIALKVGVLDKTIKKETRDTINNMLKGGGYNQRYSDLMEVNMSTTRRYFDTSLVKESGIINFIDDKNSRVVHTAYIKKNKDGSVEMFHANNMSLDGALSLGRELSILGPTTHYDLSDNYVINSLNNWLITSEHSFKFTSVSELNITTKI
ncbi:hypothetical protein CKQ84_08180 [Shewanella sp. WE21]|uniref:hypothetical protein n=1 Tax=Shewanella sp. WE21 TaxID=2029986 RepID=UPI000CF6366A|nr:hypothetical protein [Shewanella sp. WE21]AVI65861.1 hypothetical protein CKQ84_08180 [Shewanella sp. WE21]